MFVNNCIGFVKLFLFCRFLRIFCLRNKASSGSCFLIFLFLIFSLTFSFNDGLFWDMPQILTFRMMVHEIGKQKVVKTWTCPACGLKEVKLSLFGYSFLVCNNSISLIRLEDDRSLHQPKCYGS